MKTLKFLAQVGMAIVCAVLMAGCNSSPSANDAGNVLRQKIDSESQGQIKLVSFKKTDGQLSVVNAVKIYELDYEAEIEFQTDGTWFKGMQGMGFGFSTQQATAGSMAAFANQMVNGGINVHHGDRVKIAGVMLGDKKESGWVFEIGDSHLVSGPTASSPSPSKSGEHARDQTTVSDLPPNIKMQKSNGENFPPVPVPINAIDSRRTIAWGYINQSGTFIIPSRYTKAGYFSAGLAKVELLPDKNNPTKKPISGFIDVTGKLVLTEINSNGVIQYVNMDGQKVVTPQTAENDFRQACIKNLQAIETAKNIWDTEVNSGKGGTPSVSDLKPYFPNGFPVCPDGGNYTINPVGQHPVCSIPSHVAQDGSIQLSSESSFLKNFFLVKKFSEGLAPAIKTGERFCFINTNGEIVLKTSAIDAFPFSEGFARIQAENGSWGFINKAGTIIITPQFADADDFHDGLAKVVSDIGQSEYIDSEGNIVYSPDTQLMDALKQRVESKGGNWEAYKREAKTTHKANVCANNLQQIESAKYQWALANKKMTGAVPTWDDLRPYLKNGEIPQCPSGGSYTLNPVGKSAECSIPGHVLP